MRALTLAVIVAAGVGLARAPGASAAPVSNGTMLSGIINGVQPLEQAQHWRWGSRGRHWRWGSRGPWRRCHRPLTSRRFPC